MTVDSLRTRARVPALLIPYLPAPRQLRDLAYLLFGNLLKIALGFVTSAIIFRVLGPNDAGRLTLALGVVGFVSIVGEFGLRDAAVNFIARDLRTAPLRAAAVARTFLLSKAFLSAFASALGYVSAGIIASRFYPEANVASLIQLGAFSLFTSGLLGFALVILEAEQNFAAIGVLSIVQGILRAGLIVLLLVTRNVNVYSLIVLESIVPLAVFVYSLRVIPKSFFWLQRPLLVHFGALFHFTKWIGVAALASAIFNKLDVLMLSYYAPMTQVGFYAVALALVSRLDVVQNAVLTTAFPDACRRTTRDELRAFIFQSLRLTALASFTLLPLFLVGGYIIEWLYGSAYTPAIPAFYPLLVAFIVGLNAAPIAFVLYPLNQPRWIAGSDLLQLAFNVIVNLMLIPPFGILGAAWGVLLTRLTHALITFVLVRHLLWKARA